MPEPEMLPPRRLSWRRRKSGVSERANAANCSALSGEGKYRCQKVKSTRVNANIPGGLSSVRSQPETDSKGASGTGSQSRSGTRTKPADS